jgi:hypothetical protein
MENHGRRSRRVLLVLLIVFVVVSSTAFVLGFRVQPALAAEECTKYADSINGDDANSGLAGAPVKTVQKLEYRLVAGDVGCIRGGTGQVYDWVKAQYSDPDRTLLIDTPGTSATSPIVIKAEPGYARPTLRGAIQIRSPFVTLRYLNLDGYNLNGDRNGSEEYTKPSPIIYADDVKMLNSNITNPSEGGDLTGGVCIHPVGGVDGYTPTVDRLEIAGNRIHDCGFSNDSAGTHGHGVYAHRTRDMWVHDNLIYDNKARGIQLRIDADNSVIERNVLDGNSLNIIFSGDNQGLSDLPQDRYVSDNNDVHNNVITYANPRSNVDSFYPSWNGTVPGVGNAVHDNCILNGAAFNIASGGKTYDGTGYRAYSNYNRGAGSDPDVNPRFVNRAAKNFNLRSDSPCAPYLPERVVQ